MRFFGISAEGKSSEQFHSERQAQADYIARRGIDRIPPQPRDVFVQSGPRGVLVTWKSPGNREEEIVGWRIYTPDESNLFQDIRDRGTRQVFVPTSAGSTPPVVNVFISSINGLGIESNPVQAQGSATIEAGAPTMPSTPPGYSAESSGGLLDIDRSRAGGFTR